MNIFRLQILCTILLLLMSGVYSGARAGEPYPLVDPPMVCPPISDVPDIYEIGETQLIFGRAGCYVVRVGDTLLDVARENGIGYNEIVAANPDMDPWIPDVGTEVTYPTVWIIPSPLREGIVLNLAEMRLYYRFKKDGVRKVASYPVGIGREGNDTPVGVYKITEKEKYPTWYPTDTTRKEKPELPKAVPPGPDNPLGRYKMRLSNTTYLIHGTNKPFGIGRRVSSGCIRMYPEDIEELFSITPPGTLVEVVNMPVKAAVVMDRVYVEVHEDMAATKDMIEESIRVIAESGGLNLIDPNLLYDAITKKTGIPADITMSVSREDAHPKEIR